MVSSLEVRILSIDVVVTVTEIRSQQILDMRGVQVGDECFEEGHLSASVLEDDARVLRRAAEAVRGEHHGEVRGIHFGLTYHFRSGELLQEAYQICKYLEIKIEKLMLVKCNFDLQ